MSDSLEILHRKIDSATELDSVVRTMKALAASSIVQYERAVRSLDDYYRTVELGLAAWLSQGGAELHAGDSYSSLDGSGIVVFGSDLGLVGQFNEVLADYTLKELAAISGEKHVWVVGERVQGYLGENGIEVSGTFPIPNSIGAVTALVGSILTEIDSRREQGVCGKLYLFYNSHETGAAYKSAMQQLLPLDEAWSKELAGLDWPGGNLPEVVGGSDMTLEALIREYLFISLFRACVESLASENASRLAAMQRAEKNIDELLEELRQTFHHQRQASIDEELFDVVSGFEALGHHKKPV